MKSIWEWIKNNKLYLLVMIIGSFAFLLQMREVVLYADDFSLGIISQSGLKGIIEYFNYNYIHWGGGLTVIWATTFLMFRIGIWKLFQSSIVILIVILATRMITYKSKKNKALVAGTIWLLLYALSIWIQRETLYWLDGALAYTLTAFQIFLYFYYLYTRIHLQIEKKYDKFFLPIIAFFAGWSSAQTGPLTLIIPLLIISWEKIINKRKKISKFYYITTIIGLVGFAIFYFAPGNNSRMNIGFSEFANYNIAQKILYRVNTIYAQMFNFKQCPSMGIPFYLILFMGLNSTVGLNIVKNDKNKKIKSIIYLASTLQIVHLIICLTLLFDIPNVQIVNKVAFDFENLLHAKYENRLSVIMLIPYLYATLLIASIIVETYWICFKKKDPMLILTVISALFMQGVMVMAPYSPARTNFYTIMFLWFAISYLIKMAYETKAKISPLFIVSFFVFDINVGMLGLVLYLMLKTMFDYNKNNIITIVLILVIIATTNYSKTITEYTVNHKIFDLNMARIEKYKQEREQGNTNKELYIRKPISEEYGFTPLIGVEWVENAVKKYFNIEEAIFVEEKIE